jgi:hypothetical protein
MTTPPPHPGADAAPGRTEETIFTWGGPPLGFGPGAVDEIGSEMTQFAPGGCW